jgi:3-oxoacyl-[acyl-carrier protein] reductase
MVVAGIVGLSKADAKELAHLGVRINAIQPRLIRTAIIEAMPQKVSSYDRDRARGDR